MTLDTMSNGHCTTSRSILFRDTLSSMSFHINIT